MSGEAFGATGATTVAMLCILLIDAWRRPSLDTWPLYPCTVFALQGAACLVAQDRCAADSG